MGKYILSIVILSFLLFKNYENLVHYDLKIIDLKTLNQSRSVKSAREPASAPGTMKVQNHIFTYNLGCRGISSQERFVTTSEYVQLKGQICSNVSENHEQSLIYNHANSSEGFVFLTSNSEYTTDLIYLNLGENQLEMKSARGTEIVKVNVLRE